MAGQTSRVPSLWARMEIVPPLSPQGIVRADPTAWFPSARTVRVWNYWKSDPKAPHSRCEGCKVYFANTYLSTGWAPDSHYPSNPKMYCRDCMRTLQIRRE